MSNNFINNNYVYSNDLFPTRDEILNLVEDIKISNYLQIIKKNMLNAIINNEKQCILNFNDVNLDPWILNKVIILLREKGYWITETETHIIILW